MFGGERDAELKLDLKDIPSTEVRLSAWAERWTGQAPFEFSITAVGPQGEKEIYDGKNIRTGGFKTKIETRVPAGTRSLVFKLTAPENKGLKLDDLFIVPSIPMKVDPRVEMSAPGGSRDEAHPGQSRSFRERETGRMPESRFPECR